MDFDDWESDLVSRIDRGLKYGISRGADSLELYITNSHSLDVKINAGMINATQGGNIGIACRCLIGKRLGFASSSGISDTAVNFAIESALKISQTLTKEDDRWKNFVQTPEKGKDGIIDNSVLETSNEEIVKGANLIYKEAKEYDPRMVSLEGMIKVGYGVFAVGNTEGLAKVSRSTSGVILLEFIASEKNKNKVGLNVSLGRGVPNFEGIGASGAAKAIQLLDSKPLNQTGQMNIVFDNLAASQMIYAGLFNSVNGQSVVEGRSHFADRINNKIGVPFLTIYDDGQIPEDPNMFAIDDEGFPRKTTLLIENGVLKSFIFDQYYSQIYSIKSTGNCKREGSQSYESLPSILPTTISVVPGTKTLDGIISEVENGIYVFDEIMGVMNSDLISGDFSIVAPNCYKIEKGEITTPIEPITIAGNLYKAFNQIIAIGNETELTYSGKVPSIAFEGFTISG